MRVNYSATNCTRIHDCNKGIKKNSEYAVCKQTCFIINKEALIPSKSGKRRQNDQKRRVAFPLYPLLAPQLVGVPFYLPAR